MARPLLFPFLCRRSKQIFMHFSNYCWLASLLPALGKAGNNLRTKWDLAQACRCCNISLMVWENGIPEKGVFVPPPPLFSCHQHGFGKVFPPPALFLFVYSKLCLDVSLVFQNIKMCVCESLHLYLWIFTFVFVNLYICVCESLHLCLWIFIPARAVTIFQLYRRSPLLHEWWRRENKTKQLSRHCDINTLTQFFPQSSPRLSPHTRSSADDIIIIPSWSLPSLFCTRE